MKRAWMVVATCLAVGSAVAETKTLFKWVDEKGRTQYGDTPPEGFKGEVTRVQIDMNANTSVPPVRRDAAPQAKPGTAPPVPNDYLSQRRAKIAKLEARVQTAREKLAAARAALEKGMSEDEYMTVMGAAGAGAGSESSNPGSQSQSDQKKSNCREVQTKSGTKTVCPRRALNPEGQAKAQALEDAVKQAQSELEEAEAELSRERSG